MSNQLEEIGRIVTERSAGVKRQAELRRELESFARILLRIGGPLTSGLNPDALNRASSALDEFLAAGGSEKLKKLLAEFDRQSTDLARLDRSLKDAGVV